MLFAAQFLTPHSIVPRNWFSIMYFVAAGIFLVRQLAEMWKYRRARTADAAAARSPGLTR